MSIALKKVQSEFLEAVDEVINQRRPEEYKPDSDDRRAKIIMDMLSESDHGRMIIDWAKEHDVSILFDYQAQGVGGYYMIGLNTVILNGKKDNISLVTTLAHELRHAWQDHQNLITSVIHHDTVTDYIRHTKMIEADAFAFGYICGYEIHGARGMTALDLRAADFCAGIEDALAEDENALKNGKAYAAAFAAFQDLHSTHAFYNKFCAVNYAVDRKIGDYTLPEVDSVGKHMKGFEFPKRRGSDITDIEVQKRLTNVFHKYHYLPYLQEDYGNIAHSQKLNGGIDPKTRDIVKHINHAQRCQKRHQQSIKKAMSQP